jgi:hypothetical protein
MERPLSYGWTIKSMHFGRDLVGPFLFFVDYNDNQHRLDFNENQTMLLLRQLPDVIESTPR